MKNERIIQHKSATGFTLVELLVSIAVLSLIMLCVSQLMNSTVAVTLGSFKHMDADTQARVVLDRIAFDVSRMVERPDVDYYFNNAATAPHSGYSSDLMAFYSESSGYYPVAAPAAGNIDSRSTTSLVGYRIAPNPTLGVATTGVYQLERLSKALVWNGAGNGSYFPMVFLPGTLISTWTFLKTNDEDAVYQDYQVIGDQIFCMKLSYLIQTDSSTVQLTDTPNATSIAPGTVGYFDPQKVQAIIVTIAVLDSKSQKTLNNPAGAIQLAANTLNAAVPSPGSLPLKALPLNLWQAKLALELTSGSNLGLNKAAASQVRFYQRYCYLNHVLQP